MRGIVRQTLDKEFDGETLESDWMLADVHLRGYPFPDSELSVFWREDGVFVIFPISPGRFRVVANLPMTEGEHAPAPTLEQVQAIIDRRGPPGLTAFEPIWLSGFRINDRKVANYRDGRVFLLGDAAHIHSPAGGQGMNTGMQDAFNLAWKLALVLRKAGRDDLLDSYSAERSKVGDHVLKEAGRMTIVGTLRNPLAQHIRNFVAHLMFGVPPVQHAIANAMTEVAIGYPDSPLNGPALHGAGPKPGERVVPVGEQSPIGAGGTPRFALLAERSVATDDLLERFSGIVEQDVRPPLHDRGIWLARPDGYVACSASDPATIANYLEKFLG